MHSRALEPCTILRLQSWNGAALVPAAIEQMLGIIWPRETGSVSRGCAEIIRVGPTDSLLIDINRNAHSWLPPLNAVLVGSSFRATDVSQALVRLELSGPETRDLLAKGCGLDLRPTRFAPGRAARTRCAGMAVILYCTAASKFECIVTRSLSEYLSSWLADAALEFEATSR
jgi:sarcosine oxidase, subunit gamma